MDVFGGKPVIMDKLNAELAAKISAWIHRDNVRALAKKKARADAKKNGSKAGA
jgi:hypothetical protein